MNVLVTGGTGFIGSHLIERLLAKNYFVRTVAKDQLYMPQSNSPKLEILLIDLNKEHDWAPILKGIDIIYHLAGVTRAKHTQDYYEGNYLATRRFVAASKKHCRNLKRFAYVSSLTATGPCYNCDAVDETTEYHPISDYGQSKMLAEKEVLKVNQDMPVVIVRPSAVYGPRDRDMYDYFRLILQGIHPIIGFQKKYLNLIHIEDLVIGLILAGENESAVNEIFFLGSEEPYTNEQIGLAIAQVVSKHPILIRLPHALIYLIGTIAQTVGLITRKQVFLNIQKAREMVQSAWNCSITKAKERLGFHPQVTLLDGMQQTYDWYKEHNWL